MANARYAKASEAFARGNIDWVADDIRVILLDSGYTPDLNLHDNLDDVPSGARLSSAVSLTGKSATDGVLDANDVTFSAVPAGTATYVLFYKHTGNEATSTLILLFDTMTGLPLTTNGTDVVLVFDNGPDKIHRL